MRLASLSRRGSQGCLLLLRLRAWPNIELSVYCIHTYIYVVMHHDQVRPVDSSFANRALEEVAADCLAIHRGINSRTDFGLVHASAAKKPSAERGGIVSRNPLSPSSTTRTRTVRWTALPLD